MRHLCALAKGVTRKRAVLGSAASFAALAALVAPAFASASPGLGQSTIGQWRIFSVRPATSAFWDIDKAAADGNGGVEFPFAEYQTPDSGSFAVYLNQNYNSDLTGKTINVTADWTPGSYVSRGYPGDTGAYARVEFEDVSQQTSNYGSNDLWWYTGDKFDLNNTSQATGKTVTAALSDRANWSNLCGQSATDTTVYPQHTNCVGTTDPTGSPYDGFTNAMKNVKEVNLAFGRTSRYASGVAALASSSSVFDMTDFAITP